MFLFSIYECLNSFIFYPVIRTLYFNNNCIENNLNIAQVVFPVPDLPITIMFPVSSNNSLSWTDNLVLNYVWVCKKSIILEADLKSAYY